MSDFIKNRHLLVQSNKLTLARYNISPITKRIFYLAIAKIQQLDYSQDEFGHTEVKIPLKNLLHDSSYDGSKKFTNYSFIRESTKKVFKQIYEIDRIIDGNIGYEQIAPIRKVTHIKNNNYVIVTIDEAIMKYLIGLTKNFTNYKTLDVLNLKGFYSQRIFELINQFKNTGIWRISVKDLKKIFKVDKKYIDYYAFKKNTILQSQKEIKEKTDLEFTFVEKKEGRKVVGLEFKIFQKSKVKILENPEIEKIKQRIKKLDITDTQIQKINFSQDQIIPILQKICSEIERELVFRQGTINQVKSKGAFAWSIFKKYQQEFENQDQIQKINFSEELLHSKKTISKNENTVPVQEEKELTEEQKFINEHKPYVRLRENPYNFDFFQMHDLSKKAGGIQNLIKILNEADELKNEDKRKEYFLKKLNHQ